MELYRKTKLLFTRLVGMSTPAEEQELDKLMADHPRINKMYSELSCPENYERRQEQIRGMDTEKEWAYFQKRRTRRLSRPWLRWTAVILFPLLAGSTCAWLLFNYKTTDETESLISQQIIGPGSQGATLILSNGSQMQLMSLSNNIVEQDGSQIQTDSTQINYTQNNTATDYNLQNRLVVGRGFEYMLILSDGTKVWINSESTLQYPVKFNRSNPRRVELTGEAYFEVARDTTSPFIVEVNGSYAVKVLGTSFNVNAYMGNRSSETTLVNGCVEVTDYRTRENYTLTPGKQITVSPEGCLVRKVNTANYIAWHEGLFYFDNQRLDQALEMLGRWYDVDFVFESDFLKSIMVTGKLQRFENLQTILQMLTKTTGRIFEIKNKIIYVREKK